MKPAATIGGLSGTALQEAKSLGAMCFCTTAVDTGATRIQMKKLRLSDTRTDKTAKTASVSFVSSDFLTSQKKLSCLPASWPDLA